MPDSRLLMLYDLLPSGTLCDIGTDHCKLPVYAVEQGKSDRAIATDLRHGPLEAARRTVTAHGLADKITLLLSDGFADIPAPLFDSVDTFVIAGMGGELIERILRARHTAATLVLQPMSAVYELIAFLQANGYDILRRAYTRDGDKLYTALVCRYDGQAHAYDPFRNSVRDKAFSEYLDRELTRIDRALEGMRRAAAADVCAIEELERLRQLIIREKQQ